MKQKIHDQELERSPVHISTIQTRKRRKLFVQSLSKNKKVQKKCQNKESDITNQRQIIYEKKEQLVLKGKLLPDADKLEENRQQQQKKIYKNQNRFILHRIENIMNDQSRGNKVMKKENNVFVTRQKPTNFKFCQKCQQYIKRQRSISKIHQNQIQINIENKSKLLFPSQIKQKNKNNMSIVSQIINITINQTISDIFIGSNIKQNLQNKQNKQNLIIEQCIQQENDFKLAWSNQQIFMNLFRTFIKCEDITKSIFKLKNIVQQSMSNIVFQSIQSSKQYQNRNEKIQKSKQPKNLNQILTKFYFSYSNEQNNIISQFRKWIQIFEKQTSNIFSQALSIQQDFNRSLFKIKQYVSIDFNRPITKKLSQNKINNA